MEDNSKLPRILKLETPLKDSTPATFFLVVNPGLETQARKEAQLFLKAKRIDEVNGGLQFDSTWGAVRRGQPRLRVASRVLLRIDQFGARDFQKLYRKVSNIPWETWLKPKVGLLVRAASHGSRLRIKSGIEESVVEAFKKSFKAPPPRPTQELLCLVRVEDDICTISLDISGELLHKRGSHTDVGTAPLRETWAASIVDRVFEIVSDDSKLASTFNRGWEWVEPMAGTAVFLREALNTVQSDGSNSDIAASSIDPVARANEPKRVFAVDTCFKFEADSVNSDPADAESSEKALSAKDFVAKISRALIADRDEAQLARAKKALEGLGGALKISYVFAANEKKSEAKPSDATRLVIVNPPWGQRLKGPDATDSSEGQTKLMTQIEADWRPTLVAIVFPRIAGTAPKVPKLWVEHQPLEFRAGGLPVKARFFTVPSRVIVDKR